MNADGKTFLFREVLMIQKIVQDEVWLESERRGYNVSENDPIVREKVCEVVLRIGAEMRKSVKQTMAADVESQRAMAVSFLAASAYRRSCCRHRRDAPAREARL